MRDPLCSSTEETSRIKCVRVFVIFLVTGNRPIIQLARLLDFCQRRYTYQRLAISCHTLVSLDKSAGKRMVHTRSSLLILYPSNSVAFRARCGNAIVGMHLWGKYHSRLTSLLPTGTGGHHLYVSQTRAERYGSEARSASRGRRVRPVRASISFWALAWASWWRTIVSTNNQAAVEVYMKMGQRYFSPLDWNTTYGIRWTLRKMFPKFQKQFRGDESLRTAVHSSRGVRYEFLAIRAQTFICPPNVISREGVIRLSS